MKKLLLAIGLLLNTFSVYADSIRDFYFFGDSLTDMGYQNANPTNMDSGKTDIWTSPNGHTWAYYFIENYDQQSPNNGVFLSANNLIANYLYQPVPSYISPVLNGKDFAAGGATTGSTGLMNNFNYKAPSLLEQVSYFIHEYAPQNGIELSKNGYLLWAGSNDIMKQVKLDILLSQAHLFNPQNLISQYGAIENNIANNIQSAVQQLYFAGAKKIAVILIPNIGLTPFSNTFTDTLQGNGVTVSEDAVSTGLNAVVATTNYLIRMKLTNYPVVVIDPNVVFADLIATPTNTFFKEDPSIFGNNKKFLIANSTQPACPTEEALTCIPTVAGADHYVFEDLMHPTDQTHQILGDYIYYQAMQVFSKN